MKLFLPISLLACLCLSSLRANSQAIAPLRPLVVRLDSGTTTTRPLIGIVPAAYQSLREERASDEQLLLVRATRIRNLQAQHRADSLDRIATGNELRNTRLDIARLNAELTNQEVRTRKLLAQPLRKPLLLDGHTYLGGLAGLVGSALLTVLIVH
jgi:hypothetical protein